MTDVVTVSDGIAIGVAVHGDDAAPPLLLVHSLGCDHHMWDHQLGVFGRSHRVVAIDIRGHGASGAPHGDYTLARLGQDVIDVADGLEIDSFDYCGLSIGGLIGQWLGLHFADRLRSLTLCNTGAKISEVDRWNERIDLARSEGMAALVDAVIDRWFTPEFSDAHPEDIERFRSQLLATDPEGYAGCCAAIRGSDLRQEVHRIVTPTLLVAGTHDIATPPELTDHLHAQIAGSEVVSLEAGHLSNVEQPDAFTDALSRFLA